METYIGTKIIKAVLMSKGDYYRELEVNQFVDGKPTLLQALTIEPKSGSPNDEGYKVEYEDGYISWSPKEVFEKAYVKVSVDLIKSVDDMVSSANNDTDFLNTVIRNNGVAIRELIWGGIKIGMNFSKTKQSVGVVAAELKTFTPIYHYRCLSKYGGEFFIDIEVEAGDDAKSIYGKIKEKAGDYFERARASRYSEFTFQKL